MNNDLLKRVEKIEAWMKSLEDASLIPLNVDLAFRARFSDSALVALPVPSGGTGATSLSGVLKGNGASPITGISNLTGSKVYYVSDSSGGAVTRKLTFTDGVLTNET